MIGQRVLTCALIGQSCLRLGCDWLDFSASVKKMISREQTGSDSAPQRRPPSTPPLPLRNLQLVAKQPETVVFRDGRKVRGRVVRESWPSTGLTSSFRTQPIAEVQDRPSNQLRPQMIPSAPPPPPTQKALLPPHLLPHWSVPVRALPRGRGSDATMTSLLLFCHR